MDKKRGFRRIAFVLAVVAGIVCAGWGVEGVLVIHDDAERNLRWKQKEYTGLHKPVETLLSEAGFSDKETQDYRATREQTQFTREQVLAELKRRKELKSPTAELRLQELEKGFWVNLSNGGLIGLCGVGGLVGGVIGFVVVWLLYMLFEWIVSGFSDNNHLQSERA